MANNMWRSAAAEARDGQAGITYNAAAAVFVREAERYRSVGPLRKLVKPAEIA